MADWVLVVGVVSLALTAALVYAYLQRAKTMSF